VTAEPTPTADVDRLVADAVAARPGAEGELMAALRRCWPGRERRATFDHAIDDLARRAGSGGTEGRVALGLLSAAIVQTELAVGPVRLVLGRDADVDDAVQETLMAVTRSVGTWRGESHFRVWLFTVASRTAGRLASKRSQEVLSEPPDADERWMATFTSILADADLVGRVVDGLPPHLAEALRLREYEDLTYDQIAQRLDITVGAVKLRIHRARRQASQQLLAQLSAVGDGGERSS
jgi:RNA polymerase sigma-70 factor (ECF subfamily)